MCNVDYVKKDVNNVLVQQRRESLKALVVVGVILLSSNAYAVGSLGIGSPTVEDNKVVFPIVLGGDVGSGVAAMDFRFRYNPDTLRPVSVAAGSAASAANKRLQANVAAPGEYIVVVFGMSNSTNQTACTGGEVARVVMEKVSQDQKPVWDLSLDKSTLTSLNGTPIPSHSLPYRGTNSGNKPAEDDPSPSVDVSVPTADASSGKGSGTKTQADNVAKNLADAIGKVVAPPEGAPVDLAPVLAKLKEAREGVRSPGKSTAATSAPGAEAASGEAQKLASATGNDSDTRAAQSATEQDSAGDGAEAGSESPKGGADARTKTIEQDNSPKPSGKATAERGAREISLERPIGKAGVAFGAAVVIALVVIGFLVRRHRRLG